MESPSLCAGLICLDCLFPFSLRIAASFASPQGGKLWGCKVLLFPQLLTITPVTVRLSITSSHQTHTEQIEPAGIQTHIIHRDKKKETGFTGGVERWRGSCQHLLRLTGKCAQMHTHIHTPQSTSCEGTPLILVVFTQPPSMLPPTMLAYSVSRGYSAENHAAKHIHAEMTQRRTEACMCNEKQEGQTAWNTHKHVRHPKIRYSLWAAQSHRNIDFTISQIASYERSTSQLISSVSVQTTHTLRCNAHTQTYTPSPLGSCVGPKPRPRVLFHGSIITSISLHINLSTAEHTGYYQTSPAPQRLAPKQTQAK